MARKVRNASLDSRAARRALKPGPKPYYMRLHDGLHLGYRKGARRESAGKWVVRRYLGGERYVVETIAVADDLQDADGSEVLTFDQAQVAARQLVVEVAARERAAAEDAPVTVASAIDEYLVERDARAKDQAGASKSDARYRLTKHMDEALAATQLRALTAEQLANWRESLEGLSRSSVDRLSSDLRAALNAAALKYRSRLPSSVAMEVKAGLRSGGGDAETAVRATQILSDEQVRQIIVAAGEVDAEDEWDGLLLPMVVTLAATGARFSQVRRMVVGDLQQDQKRVMVPVSRKGTTRKAAPRIGVAVGEDVVLLLQPLVSGRGPAELLLRRPSWEQRPRPGKINIWRKSQRLVGWLNAFELRKPWARILAKAGLSDEVIPYALRHSSIVRGLRQGLPTRLVAALHDTSSAMIERHYSAYIVDALGEVAARAVVPLVRGSSPDEVPGGNVVTMKRAREK